ncbi:MAG: S-layer homology domain-containing protein [Clostridia bacterium]|nr:S-layer homology domain-containing protein [Clostridia bacterium]
MKNFKRILATVLAVLFVASMMVVGVSAAPSDKAWYKAAVDYLDGLTISNIGSAGEEPVSRDEFVTWVAKIESHQLIESAWKRQEWVALSTFSDVGDSEHQGAIGYAIGRNFIKGNGDGTFSPHEAVKFGEAAAIVVRLMGYENKVTGATWDEQVANYEFVANTFCGAFDATFLAKTAQYDADHKLSKGEAAYILYTIMNGAAWADDDITDTEYASLRLTSYGVDLGEFFATNGGATVKAQYVVANIPLVYTNTTQSFRRYDAYVTGATYDSLFANKLYNTNGLIDKTSGKVVTLQNLTTGNYVTISTSAFASLVKTAAGHKDDDTDALNYISVGNVVTISAKRDNKDALAGSATATSALSTSVITNFVINDSTAADGYVGTAATTLANINTGAQVTGWKFLGAKAAASSTYTRLTSTPVTWSNVKYKNGVPTSGNLVLGEETYTVVTSYTGKANEIKVYAPSGILSGGTTKAIVSVVGAAGDVVYKGGVFSADQKAILNLHRSGVQALAVDIDEFAEGVVYYELVDDEYVVTTDADVDADKTYYIDNGYNEYFDGNTVTTTFTIEETIPSWIAYELNVTGGKFVTNTSFNLVSDFIVDGRIDKNMINTAKALKVEEALQLILGPAQGECEVIFSDTDGDGAYDIAVVTESSRALYYGEVNSATDPAGEGYLGGNAAWTREVYDSFGNYITSVQGLKGHNIGGLVVDKTVAQGGTTGGGTDGWNTTSTVASNKVQLVVCMSNERQIYGGNNDTALYGVSNVFPYKTVDVATLTTGYIEWVASGTSKVGGVEVYTASVIKADGERTTVYIPVNPASNITLSVTVDGVASDVTFAAGKSLLSFVTDHVADSEIGTVQTGSWMAGHTVKYVAYENGVAWCMVDTAVKSAVTGYVTGVTKTDSGDNTYKVTVVASAADGTYSASFAPTAESIANVITYGYGSAMIANSFGIDALFAAEGEMTVKAYVVTEGAINEFTTLTNSNIFQGIGGNAPLTGMYYADDQGAVVAPDGTIKPTLVGTGYVSGSTFNKAGIIISQYDYFTYVRPQYQNDTYFTETEFDAHDLFGYIDWTAIGDKTASSTTKYIGASVKTLEVKGSATAVWTYDAPTYALVNAVLVKGTLYNTNNIENDQVVSQNDLVYLSFTKDAGSYYTIEGLDSASYNVDVDTGASDWGAIYMGNNANFFNADHLSTNYRSRVCFGYRYPLLTTGAGTDMMWTNGHEEDFENAYILGYTKTDDDRVYLQGGNGYYDMYDMIVGYNPYYVRNISNDGKITYTLMFSLVKKLSGVKGTFYYPVDANSTLLIALINQSTMKQEVDDGVSYTDTATYYVDPTTSLVYLVHGDPVYDETKTTKDTPEYDTTDATDNGIVYDIPADAIKSEFGLDKDVKEENLVSLSFAPFTEDEQGYVPGLYHAYLTDGLGSVRRFQINQNVKIVVIYPDSETGNFKITVTTAKDIYANKATVFVTDYQYKGAEACTMLSVIGKINKPVAAVVDDNENTVTAGSKLVYLNGDATVIAEAIQLSNYWVIRSTDSAIDVTTGEEVGSIQFVFTTYKEDEMTRVQAALKAGGFFLINKDNEVISAVSEAAGEYGTATEYAQVLTGVITGVTADGKTTATIKGVENTDISNKTFKFIYHDMDGANFGIGGTSTNVAVSTTTEIKATYSADEAIVAEGVGKAPNYYTKDDVDTAAANVAAAKVAAIDAYLNGTFWNVEFSPLYNYFVSQRVSYQNRGEVTLTFNYVVINDVYYVFVNSFAK